MWIQRIKRIQPDSISETMKGEITLALHCFNRSDPHDPHDPLDPRRRQPSNPTCHNDYFAETTLIDFNESGTSLSTTLPAGN